MNEARMKSHNDIRDCSSSNTIGDDEDEGMNVNDNDNSYGTSKNPLQHESLVDTPICRPSSTNAKKIPVASSS